VAAGSREAVVPQALRECRGREPVVAEAFGVEAVGLDPKVVCVPVDEEGREMEAP
jgi:hypothetical protein